MQFELWEDVYIFSVRLALPPNLLNLATLSEIDTVLKAKHNKNTKNARLKVLPNGFLEFSIFFNFGPENSMFQFFEN